MYRSLNFWRHCTQSNWQDAATSAGNTTTAHAQRCRAFRTISGKKISLFLTNVLGIYFEEFLRYTAVIIFQ